MGAVAGAGAGDGAAGDGAAGDGAAGDGARDAGDGAGDAGDGAGDGAGDVGSDFGSKPFFPVALVNLFFKPSFLLSRANTPPTFFGRKLNLTALPPLSTGFLFMSDASPRGDEPVLLALRSNIALLLKKPVNLLLAANIACAFPATSPTPPKPAAPLLSPKLAARRRGPPKPAAPLLSPKLAARRRGPPMPAAPLLSPKLAARRRSPALSPKAPLTAPEALVRASLNLNPQRLSLPPSTGASADITHGSLWLTVSVDIPGGYENEGVGIRMSACPHVRMSACPHVRSMQ